MLRRVRAGGTSLHPFEIEELGDVRGRSLLHLQSHIGTESASWARLGAQVTAVDYSSEALAQVAALADELGFQVRCVEADVLRLREVLDATFDVVYTSWGVLLWLPDLRRWGSVVAESLSPGGTFYIAEFHPLAWIFDHAAPDLRVRYPYFGGDAPERDDTQGTYADRDAVLGHRITYTWPYPLGEVISALTGAGLRLEFLHEHETCPERFIPALVPDERGPVNWYRMPDELPRLPLSFSLRATREQTASRT